MSRAGMYGYWIPPVFWAVVILFVSSLPTVEVDYPRFNMADKMAHFAEYLVLSVLLGRLFLFSAKLAKYKYAGPLLLGFGLGGIDEFHQYFIPNRFCEWGDFLFDAAGVAFGLIVYVVFRKVKR